MGVYIYLKGRKFPLVIETDEADQFLNYFYGWAKNSEGMGSSYHTGVLVVDLREVQEISTMRVDT